MPASSLQATRKRRPLFVRLDALDEAKLLRLCRAWGLEPGMAVRRLIREAALPEGSEAEASS